MMRNETVAPPNRAPRDRHGDTPAAIGGILYLLIALIGCSWLLFDTWMDAHTLVGWAGYRLDRLYTPAYHIVAATVIGGALGGIVNGIRSALAHYVGFNRRHLWKYIAAPWMGAALALLAYALLRSTAAIFGGQGSADTAPASQVLANFAAGALAGYGAKDVFIWLDAQVHKLFAVPEPAPNVQGQPEAVAVSRIHAQDLAVGAIAPVPSDATTPPGVVVDQAPSPGTPVVRGDQVDLMVATDSAATNGAAHTDPRADDPPDPPQATADVPDERHTGSTHHVPKT